MTAVCINQDREGGGGEGKKTFLRGCVNWRRVSGLLAVYIEMSVLTFERKSWMKGGKERPKVVQKYCYCFTC